MTENSASSPSAGPYATGIPGFPGGDLAYAGRQGTATKPPRRGPPRADHACRAWRFSRWPAPRHAPQVATSAPPIDQSRPKPRSTKPAPAPTTRRPARPATRGAPTYSKPRTASTCRRPGFAKSCTSNPMAISSAQPANSPPHRSAPWALCSSCLKPTTICGHALWPGHRRLRAARQHPGRHRLPARNVRCIRHARLSGRLQRRP